MLNNKNEQEQKPRKLDPRIGDFGASRNEIIDANLKSFYKPWKDDSPIEASISVDDYDEHRRASEPKQQPSNYDAWWDASWFRHNSYDTTLIFTFRELPYGWGNFESPKVDSTRGV